MPLDLTELQSSLRIWAEDVFDGAVDGMMNALDDVVPHGEDQGREGVRLAESRRVDRFGGLSAEIAYEADHASYTDEGTPPHKIEGNPLLAFHWNGQLVIVHSVNHPGTAGTRWWTNTFSDSIWGQALQEAADRTTFR